MRQSQLGAALPWLMGLGLSTSLVCIAAAIYLVWAAEIDAHREAARQLAGQADRVASQIGSDLAQYDLTLREAASLLQPRPPGAPLPSLALLDLPLTASYIGFINILNESGDVVADPRSNVSRPLNFKGRDYFKDHLTNPADILMIGRPFAGAPNQHASIPISRRLNHLDGSFAGVVVAGVHLTWLSDLLSRPSPGPRPAITIRRGDGLVLMRTPYDQDAIGRSDSTDPAWQAFLRTGLSQPLADSTGTGIQLFHRLGIPNLVLELTLSQAEIAATERAWLLWIPPLALFPGLCVLGLSLVAHRLRGHGDRIEAAANAAFDESQRLLGNMSHELRSPLTGILGQAELLTVEGGLSARQMTRLARLTEAGTLMRDIVDRVIDIACPEDVTHTPVLTACDLDPLLHTVLGVVEGEARRKGLLLTSFIDPATPRRAMLDRDRVQQMLINLLMNAVKYTPRGSVSVLVTGSTANLRFAVTDTGPGIAADKKHRLFQAYDRLDTPAGRVEGSGLGLSITERFANRMGGQLGHSANPGGGSVFWFELPFIEPVVTTEQITPAASPVDIRHLRVLLADDLDLTRTVTADYLRSGGHVVTEVANGEAAIDLVCQHDFDVVLTDMRMPVVDGLEVTRRIRAMGGHRARTPIVLVTADLAAIRAGESGQTGVDVCVRKPFTRAELLSAVATAARLAPLPDPAVFGTEVLDTAALAELKQTLGYVTFTAQLDGAARRIAGLLSLLAAPDAPDQPELRDAAHDLAGICGLMGLNVLGSTLRWFDTATDRTAPTAALHEAAEASLRALRRQQEAAAAGC
jgi:signal transduction histidine kinase/DNA-binding NarL/FixJ family response regulator